MDSPVVDNRGSKGSVIGRVRYRNHLSSHRSQIRESPADSDLRTRGDSTRGSSSFSVGSIQKHEDVEKTATQAVAAKRRPSVWEKSMKFLNVVPLPTNLLHSNSSVPAPAPVPEPVIAGKGMAAGSGIVSGSGVVAGSGMASGSGIVLGSGIVAGTGMVTTTQPAPTSGSKIRLATEIVDRTKTVIFEAASTGGTELDLSRQDILYLPTDIRLLCSTLEELNLCNNLLVTLPPEIGELKALISLQIESNAITYLPPQIGQLTRLERLFLNNNKLVCLPPEIGQLTNLVWLSADNNRLTSLPKEIGLLKNLGWISVENNDLTSLPIEMGLLSKLESLSIYNNMNLKILPPALIGLQGLQDVRILSWKNVRGFAGGTDFERFESMPQYFELPKGITLAGPKNIVQYLKELDRLHLPLHPGMVRSHWVPDETVANCPACGVAYSNFTRRHHCRLCGNVFCKKCSGQKCQIPQFYIFDLGDRVCQECYQLLQTDMRTRSRTQMLNIKSSQPYATGPNPGYQM
eukprot:TRINITY_DN3811_c0_g1_i1.p1 TRINITY_DN3811_c0_g1~~TRINITY_DN3811_c0_g1_i1.p1  ORF type:complete len:518 (-),score=69.18 TRINITY_DN3811_c0_g1_i1:21-1574(-)